MLTKILELEDTLVLYENVEPVAYGIKDIAQYLKEDLKDILDIDVKIYGDSLYIKDSYYSIDDCNNGLNLYFRDCYLPYEVRNGTYQATECVGEIEDDEDLEMLLALKKYRAESTGLPFDYEYEKQFYKTNLHKTVFVFTGILDIDKLYIVSMCELTVSEDNATMYCYTLPEERYRNFEPELSRMALGKLKAIREGSTTLQGGNICPTQFN